MKVLFFALALLLCTRATAQSSPDSVGAPAQLQAQRSAEGQSSTVQKTIEIGANFTYSLRTNNIERKEVLLAFGEVAGLDINAKFTGDWTTTDDDGIEYSLNTRRNRLSIKYRGKDKAITELAAEKARALREELGLADDDDDDDDDNN